MIDTTTPPSNKPEKSELIVVDNGIKWERRIYRCGESIRWFLGWFHGKSFEGNTLKAFRNIRIKHDKFNIFLWDSSAPNVTEKPLVLYGDQVQLVVGTSLFDFLEKNYVPLGNECKENFDEWISSGRLALFDKEFRVLSQRHSAAERKCDQIRDAIVAKYHTGKRASKIYNGSSLKKIIEFALNATDDLEATGVILPDDYNLRPFLVELITKRQRLAASPFSRSSLRRRQYTNYSHI